MGKARRCLFDHDTTADDKPRLQEEMMSINQIKQHETSVCSSNISYKAALLLTPSALSSSEEIPSPVQSTTPTPTTTNHTTNSSKKKKKRTNGKKRETTSQQKTPSATPKAKTNLLIDSPLHDSAERIIQRPSSPSIDPKSRHTYSLWSGPASPFFASSSSSTTEPTDTKTRLPCSLFTNIFLEATLS